MRLFFYWLFRITSRYPQLTTKLKMTLHEVITELEACKYTCEAGPLERNRAWIALKAMAEKETDICDNEPYMGWCDVEGCQNEAAANGICWPDTGYWLCCSDHAKHYRLGLPQPRMKRLAFDREASRGEDGHLP